MSNMVAQVTVSGALCSNRVLIRQDRLEEQLINGLTHKVLRKDMIEYLVRAVCGRAAEAPGFAQTSQYWSGWGDECIASATR